MSFRKLVLGLTNPYKISFQGEICTHLYILIWPYLYLMYFSTSLFPRTGHLKLVRINSNTILQSGFMFISTLQNWLEKWGVVSHLYTIIYSFLVDVRFSTVATQSHPTRIIATIPHFKIWWVMYFILVHSTIPHGINLIIHNNEFP